MNKFFKQLKKISKSWPSDGNPFSPGVRKALYAIENGDALGLNKAVMDEVLTDRTEIIDFVATLSRTGILCFAYTAPDTALMDTMCEFLMQGCAFDGFTFISQDGNSGGEIKGIVLSLPKKSAI